MGAPPLLTICCADDLASSSQPGACIMRMNHDPRILTIVRSTGKSRGPSKNIATQDTKTAINQIISQIIGVPHNGIYASVTKNHISYQDALGDYMQETADREQKEPKYHGGNAITVDCRGDKATQNNEISKVTSGKQMFFGLHGSTLLNGLALARCRRGVSKVHRFR